MTSLSLSSGVLYRFSNWPAGKGATSGKKKERTEQVRGSSLVPFLNEKGRGHRLHALEFPVLTFPSEAAVRFF